MRNLKQSPRTQQVDRFGDVYSPQFSVGFGVIDMSTETEDYKISDCGVHGQFLPNFITLIPEEGTGEIIVELFGMDVGDTYTITEEQVKAHLGKPLPFKVQRVIKSGTTAKFSVVW